jgi:hypothetical protein
VKVLGVCETDDTVYLRTIEDQFPGFTMPTRECGKAGIIGGTSTTCCLDTKGHPRQLSGSTVGSNVLCTLDRYNVYPLVNTHLRYDTNIEDLLDEIYRSL